MTNTASAARPAHIVARETEDVRVLLALRAVPAELLSACDRGRLAGLERVVAARLRVAVRVAIGG